MTGTQLIQKALEEGAVAVKTCTAQGPALSATDLQNLGPEIAIEAGLGPMSEDRVRELRTKAAHNAALKDEAAARAADAQPRENGSRQTPAMGNAQALIMEGLRGLAQQPYRAPGLQ